jgi:hypothetical protein
MTISTKHKEKLKEYYNSYSVEDPLKFGSGFVWINDKIKNVILEGVDNTSFTSLYPNILCALFDEGFIDEKEKINISKLKYFIDNRQAIKNTPEYQQYKIFVNGYYGKLGMTREGRISILLVSDYLNLIYQELMDNNPYKILYIDTDTIYHVGELNFGDLDIPKTQSTIDVICMQDKKRYVFHDGNNFITKGHNSPYPHDKKRRSEVESEIKAHIRNKKLNTLGI